MVRKRFQTTIPVPENQYVRLQGNTSPIGNIYIKQKHIKTMLYNNTKFQI